MTINEVIAKTLKEKQEKERLIAYQINHKEEFIDYTLFNPFDYSTFCNARKDVVLFVDGIPMYHTFTDVDGLEKKDYVFENEFVDLLSFDINNLNKSIDEYLQNCFYIHYYQCFPVLKSNLTYNNYTFSLAQKQFIKDLPDKQIALLSTIINNHFEKKQKKYLLKQNIFDSGIGIDTELFSELCYAKYFIDEKDIMYNFYIEHDSIKTIQELESLLDNDYLLNYQQFKNIIKTYMINTLFK